MKPEIRIAVEAAFQWSVREYRNMDEADLAALAEAVALSTSKRRDEIQSPRRYAFAALTGRLQEWFRLFHSVPSTCRAAPTSRLLPGVYPA